jgi:hypothetical protein
LYIPDKNKPLFKIYTENIRRITNVNIKKYGQKFLKNYELLSENKKRRDVYSIDHKYSIFEGFKKNISPEIIGSIVNLEIMILTENCSKYNKCSITKKQLINEYNNFNKNLSNEK